jgi:hypothetical protein
MPIAENASINGLFSTPLVLPAPMAGALAALFLVMLILAIRRAAHGTGSRLLLGLSVIAIGALAVFAGFDRLATSERAAEQRALLERSLQLSTAAVAPGSPLACLDSAAGEQVENACEKAVFADAQSTASAVAYIGARLLLLADATALAQRGNPDFLAAFVSTRRAVELDRYGIAAHVLAVRDGCTAERCAAFAMLQDAATLKANLKVGAFDTYVARYVSIWGKGEPMAEKQPQAALPPMASASQPPPGPHPVDSRYDFPSAASIPPVSIMNAEPPAPKEHTGTATGAAGGEKAAGNPPAPQKRPQGQAASPPAR